jgi:C4-dicarboxylate transporter, DctQ subunit
MAMGATHRHPVPRPLALFETLCAGLNRIAEFVVGLLVAVMTVDIFVQVVFRYGLQSALSWSEELARYLFVWVIFVGVSVAVRRNQHISMTALVGFLPTRTRAALTLLALLAFIGFLALLGWVSVPLIQNARGTVSSELQLPIAWVYAAAPIGAALSILHLLNKLAQQLWDPAE